MSLSLYPTLEKMKDAEDARLAKDERIYAAAFDYEETLSPDKLFAFIAELFGSVGAFLTLRH